MNDKNLKERLSFEWHSIIRDLKKNFWIPILTVLIGLMGIYIMQQRVYNPEYTSTATLVVSSKVTTGSTYSNLSVSSEMATVFSEIFVQPSMKDKAAEEIGDSYFKGSVTCTVISETNVLLLSVKSSRPEKAFRLLKAILTVYPQISDTIFSNAVIDVIKSPEVPKSPSNSITSIDKLYVVLGCALLPLLFIVFLSLARDTIKDQSSFSRKIDAKLIGVVPHESKHFKIKEKLMRKKKGLLIHESATISLKFTEAFYKIATKLEYNRKRHGDNVILISSVSEDEGKSTVSSNIAVSLAERGNSVMLIDLDEKKPALYKIFSAKYEENTEFGSLISGEIKFEDYKFRKYKKTGLFLALNTKPHKGYQKWIENGTVENIVSSLKTQVDFIIIDTAPISVDSSVTNISRIADKTLLVCRTDTVYSKSINEAILTLQESGGELLGCVLNDVYPEFSFFGQSGFDESGYYYDRKYYKYNKYGKYGKYGNKYGKYGKYSKYNKYGKYNSYSRYGNYEKYSRYHTYNNYSKYQTSSEMINGEEEE